jgi:hypothetical protein
VINLAYYQVQTKTEPRRTPQRVPDHRMTHHVNCNLQAEPRNYIRTPHGAERLVFTS